MAGEFDPDLPFAMGQVEMRDRFGDGEETMNVVGAGKHSLRDLPRRGAALLYQSDHLCLAVLKRPEITMEEFFVVAYHVAMTAVNQRRRTGAQPGEADQILGQ